MDLGAQTNESTRDAFLSIVHLGLVLQSMQLDVETALLQNMLLDASAAMPYKSADALKIKIRVHTILNNTQISLTSSLHSSHGVFTWRRVT